MTTVNTYVTITDASKDAIQINENKTIKDAFAKIQEMQKEIEKLKQIIEELKNGTGS